MTITTYKVADFRERSSLIEEIGYSPIDKILRLKFYSNEYYYYDYEGVPALVYANILKVKSMGRYYNRNIRGATGGVTLKYPMMQRPVESAFITESSVTESEDSIVKLAKEITNILMDERNLAGQIMVLLVTEIKGLLSNY